MGGNALAALQSIAGNRAVSTLVQGNAAQHTEVMWQSPTWVMPSSEGVMGGVVLVTVGAGTFALKAADENASQMVFGERLLASVGGGSVLTPDSRPIPVASPEGAEILSMLEGARSKVEAERRDNYDQKLTNLKRSRYVVVQRALGGLGALNKVTANDMGHVLPAKAHDVTTDEGTARRNEQLQRAYGMGRALAGDLLIGNADRLDTMNPGNLFLEAKGRVGAIDTEAIMQKRSAMASGREQMQPRDWAAMLVGGGEAAGPELAARAPSANLRRAADFDRWFEEDQFKEYFADKMRDIVAAKAGRPAPRGRMSPEERTEVNAALDQYDWASLKAEMRRGFDDGLAAVNQMVGQSQGRKALKKDLRSAEGQYGTSANMDWNALKVRGTYLSSVQTGMDPKAAAAQAVEQAEYLETWKPLIEHEVASLTEFPDSALFDVPQAPAELSMGRKILRALTPRSAAEKRASQLKKGIREGEVDLYDPETTSIDGNDRRSQKANFELHFAWVMDSFHKRVGTLQQLKDAMDGIGADTMKAKKWATFARVWKRAGEDTKTAAEDFENLGWKWKSSFKTPSTRDHNDRLGEAMMQARLLFQEVERRAQTGA